MIQIQLTPEQFAARQQQVSDKLGKPLTGNKGTITAMGATVEYSYDGETLTCTCVKSPFPMTKGFVEGHVQDWFRS